MFILFIFVFVHRNVYNETCSFVTLRTFGLYPGVPGKSKVQE